MKAYRRIGKGKLQAGFKACPVRGTVQNFQSCTGPLSFALFFCVQVHPPLKKTAAYLAAEILLAK